MSRNYLYHPLGAFGEKIMNGTASVDAKAHTYGPHGWSKCDWNPGSGLEVYSMTDGTIVGILQRNDRRQGENRKGYWVFIKPEGLNYTGDCYIRYMEMGGLSDNLCDQVTVFNVPKGRATYSAANGEWTQQCSIPVTKGTLLGYTNAFPGQSDVHIDFMKNAFNPDDSGPDKVPNISGMQLADGFTVTDNKIYKDGTIIGTQNGNVPLLGGGDSNYSVYPIYSYCIQLQKPEYLQAGAGDIVGKLSSKYTPIGNNAPGPDYGTKVFSSTFMGTKPTSFSQLQSSACTGLRILCHAATGEMGFSEFGLTYGKLFRTWIMYSPEKHGKRANQTTSLLDFANFWNNARVAWYISKIPESRVFKPDNSTEEQALEFAQNLYDNIRYPDAFGITNEYALYAAFSGPFQNQYNTHGLSLEAAYGPFVWKVSKNILGLNGNETTGARCFLLYRTTKYSVGTLNPNI